MDVEWLAHREAVDCYGDQREAARRLISAVSKRPSERERAAGADVFGLTPSQGGQGEADPPAGVCAGSGAVEPPVGLSQRGDRWHFAHLPGRVPYRAAHDVDGPQVGVIQDVGCGRPAHGAQLDAAGPRADREDVAGAAQRVDLDRLGGPDGAQHGAAVTHARQQQILEAGCELLGDLLGAVLGNQRTQQPQSPGGVGDAAEPERLAEAELTLERAAGENVTAASSER